MHHTGTGQASAHSSTLPRCTVPPASPFLIPPSASASASTSPSLPHLCVPCPRQPWPATLPSPNTLSLRMSPMNMDQAYMYTPPQPPYSPVNPGYHRHGNSARSTEHRRHRLDPSSPCLSPAHHHRKHAHAQQGTAFAYQAMSRTLPRLDELFASEQIIAPGKTATSQHASRQPEPSQASESIARTERYPGISSSLDQYALSRKNCQRGQENPTPTSTRLDTRFCPGQAATTIRSSDLSRPSLERSASKSRPDAACNLDQGVERSIRVETLLNHSEQYSRREAPALVDTTSAPPSPDQSHTDRHDSPIEDCKPFLYHAPPPSSFTPATYVYQAAAYEGIQDVPGVGPHHFYRGGLCIPTHVYGEAVNPMWGLTRGKVPRKRLSVACQTCRAKKIRCEPSFGGCLQCKKAEKPCRV